MELKVKFFQVNWWFKPAGERSWRTVKMYSKQDLSHVTKYDKYDRYSIDNRLGQYEGRVGKLKFLTNIGISKIFLCEQSVVVGYAL